MKTEEEETMVNEEAAPAEESILNEEAEFQRSDLEDVPAADPEGSSAAPPTRLKPQFWGNGSTCCSGRATVHWRSRVKNQAAEPATKAGSAVLRRCCCCSEGGKNI